MLSRSKRDKTEIQRPDTGGRDRLEDRAARRAATARERRVGRREASAQHRRRRAQVRAGTIIATLAVIVLGSFLAFSWYSDREARQPPAGVETFEDLEREHTQEPVDYEVTPPVGGAHSPIWQNCGFYAAPINSENAVHSLEHGAVWITYHPDLPAEQVEELRELAEEQTFILVSPYPDLQAPVVASAWGRQLELESVDDPDLAQFIRAFRQGPQTPEPGAVCTGGTSATR